MIDKRRHKRFPLSGSVVLRYKVGETIESTDALISDISISGIGLYADIPLKDHLDVTLEIHFISVDGICTDAIEGTIVYSNKWNDMFFIGVQFQEEIDEKKQPSLFKQIQALMELN
jgi:hypothetical protein